MSIAQVRGGVPSYETVEVTTTGRKYQFLGHDNYPRHIFYAILRNKGAVPVRLYFTAKDFNADVGAALLVGRFITIPISAASEPYGEWEGPVELDHEDDGCYLRAVGGAGTIEMVGFQRRG